MKHVLLFIDSLGAGGAQRQLVGLAVLLKQEHYNVKVVTYYDHPFYLNMLEGNGIEYECLNVHSTRCLLKLVRTIRKFQADCIVSFLTNPNIMACMASLLTGVKLIVSERNTHLSVSKKDRIAFNLYRLADYVVPNSYTEKTFIDNHFGHLHNKTIAITNFVDLGLFRLSVPKNKNDVLKIIVVASVKASKNTKNFIRAFNLAASENDYLQVEWYGLNPKEYELPNNLTYAAECIDLLKELGMEKRFKLFPKVANIQEKYWESDIFCLPSHFEGTPNALCEAMAASLPIMCSNVCDNPRFVEEGENGMLFNPNDICDIARVLAKFSQMTSAQLVAWGRKSRELAEKLCGEQAFVNKYIGLIES